ncbi:S8 family serine peptidase [Streptomyces pini]|uniref:Subtilase family protein n=1 Tax=Streptomyces pini TaxID=1520580 RepID=A0A1I4GUE5_9ACTN|nr:S8 family serine peptidase [Streptomyces pini]SFL33722.1 Subtilase family protein [Streptomyces pini]
MRRDPASARAAAAVLPAAVLLLLTGSGPALAGPEPVELPVVRSELAQGEACAGASGRTARSEPWTTRALGLSRAWQHSQGAGVTVAVVDTGVGTSIPALAGRVETAGSADGDCVGHGSFAAGMIAAARTDGVGAAGVAPAARILAVRGTDERGATTPALLASGIRTAAEAGAQVIYVARALPAGKEELTAAVAYATGRDALVVAPFAPDALPEAREEGKAGKEKRAAPLRYWPAAVPGVLAVMGYGPGGRSAGTPTTPAADLAAPGDAVVGSGPEGTGHYLGSGSSLAAANVAGAAALVRARHPGLDAAEVSRRLTATAYPASPARLDVYAALTAVPADAVGAVPQPPPADLPAAPPRAPRHRAVLVASAGGGLVLLVAAAAAVIPRGRARRWRPAD